MSASTRLLCLSLSFLLASCFSYPSLEPEEMPGVHDRDSDTISDRDEGRYRTDGAPDFDGDTIPDYEDEDSDDDRIPDAFECGDEDYEPCVDSDGDTLPDIHDTDSDDNGVLDINEGFVDMDGDGIGDHADPDNDGDSIDDVVELQGNPLMPVDTDGDMAPDYKDFDSDNDTISDRDERNVNTDEDLIPNYRDQDSDNDGIPDVYEAGDDDIATQPRDTDGDYVPDFIDTDSDNDGLSDECENDEGLDPYGIDSDGDGAPDGIEAKVCTDPGDPDSCPAVSTDYAAVIPHLEDPYPEVLTVPMNPESYRNSISLEASDYELDDIDATVFVDHIEPNTSGVPSGHASTSIRCPYGLGVEDTTGDTIPDTFPYFYGGGTLCFDMHMLRNEAVEETDSIQYLRVNLELKRRGLYLISSTDFHFIVPPSTCDPDLCP